MNDDEPIEAALKRRPSDERVYEEPMAALVRGDGVQRVRPVTRSRMRAPGLRALVGVGAVLVLAGALIRVGLPFGTVLFGGGNQNFEPTGLVGCWGQGPGFSPQVLTSTKTDAEKADTGAAAALRADLVREPDMPASGWMIVSESDSQVMFIAREATGSVEVTVQRGSALSGGVGAAGWQVAGSGGCQLMAVAPAGYGPATWGLDPSVPYSASATQLVIMVQESACNGGTSAEGRIETHVDYGESVVTVSVFVRSLSGFQTCPLLLNTPPYILRLDQPVGSRELVDGGLWPAHTLAIGGRPVVTPSPTPYPSNWHMPMDCTGEADGPGSFKAASMSATYDVYCAALPAGWHRESMSGDEQLATMITVTYRGPNGETLTLSEGNLCSAGRSACATAGTSAGAAMFGDREGQLFEAPPGADYALYVAPGQSPSWMATGKGMSLEAFKAMTAALIIVGK